MAKKDMASMLDGFEVSAKREHAAKASVASGESVRATSLISMTQEEKERYTVFAKVHGMSMSSLVRIAIDEFIEGSKEA